MAEYLRSINYDDKEYHLSHDKSDIYFDRNNKTGGITLKGAEFKNNVIRDNVSYEKLSDYQICEKIEKTLSSSSCFLTTIVCEGLGKEDHCEELTTLRKFRDEYIRQQPYGNALIAEYYRIAPPIVVALKQSEDFHHQVHELHEKYILTCLRYIETGQEEQAVDHYRQFVETCKTIVDK